MSNPSSLSVIWNLHRPPTMTLSGISIESRIPFFERYNFALLDIDYYTLLKIPDTFRKGNWNVTVEIWMRKH